MRFSCTSLMIQEPKVKCNDLQMPSRWRYSVEFTLVHVKTINVCLCFQQCIFRLVCEMVCVATRHNKASTKPENVFCGPYDQSFYQSTRLKHIMCHICAHLACPFSLCLYKHTVTHTNSVKPDPTMDNKQTCG